MPDFSLAKALAWRFVRGFAASFIAAAGAATVLTGVDTWTELATAMNMLAIVGTVAGISGGLLALDKYFRSE